MFERIAFICVLIFIVSGCATIPAITPTLSEPTRVIGTPTRGVGSITASRQRAEIAIFGEQGAGAITAGVGSTVAVRIAFRPYQQIDETRSDGSTNRYETDWKNHSITEMRYCVDVGRTCTLSNEWKPFANEARAQVVVTWIGLRDYGVTAQFRDVRGNLVPAGHNLAESANNWIPITGVIDDKTPVASQPSAIQTIIAQARAAFPVSGKIQVGERPLMGGKAGSSLTVKVKFEAASPLAEIKEMRVKQSSAGRCLTPEEMNDAKWEPFVAERTYPVTSIPINWSSFKLHAQFRDAKGNVSPVSCGEISIEGMP